MLIYKLFEAMQTDKKQFFAAKKGSEFEDRIKEWLDSHGYNRILQSDLRKSDDYSHFKTHWNDKWGVNALINPTEYNKHYIHQPRGSQDYPDFLILEGKHGISIETKFSGKNVKPVWNSGLPRPNGIYVVATYEKQDITFFLGQDVVNPKQARKMHEFFDFGLKEYQREFNYNDLKHQNYGFEVYIRKAFAQSRKNDKGAILDFFSNEYRDENEQKVIEHIKSIDS